MTWRCWKSGTSWGIFNYLTRLADGFGLQLDRRTIEASETGISLRQMAEQAADD